ncbi:MAG: tectonin domain-containing protein [bacterium]
MSKKLFPRNIFLIFLFFLFTNLSPAETVLPEPGAQITLPTEEPVLEAIKSEQPTTETPFVEQATPTTQTTEGIKESTAYEKILKYGDRIRLRFANLENTTLHTQQNYYTQPNTSKNQIISGYLNVNAYQKYQQNLNDDEWIIAGPFPLPQDYKKGEAVKSGDVVRFLNPKTQKYLHYFYDEKYKAPGSDFLLEVCAFDQNSPANNWQINVVENTNVGNEIIFNKTLFTIEALNDLEKKYISISQALFMVVNQNQQVAGLTDNKNNTWFIEQPNQKPEAAPKKEITVVEEVKGEEKVKKEEQKITGLTNTMWAIDTFGRALVRENINETNQTGNNWSNVSENGLAVKIINNIAVGPQSSLWIIDNSNQLYFKQSTTPWILVPNSNENTTSQFLDIDIGTNIPGGGNYNIWAIGTNNKIYYRLGTTTSNLMGTDWQEIPFQSKLNNDLPKQISVDPIGNLAIVTTLGNIYYRQTNIQNPTGTRWLEITKNGMTTGEPIKQVRLGPNAISWALNSNQRIYFMDNIVGAGKIWQEIPDGYLTDIAINVNGTVIGINANGNLYKRVNTEISPQGSGWVKLKENVQKVCLATNNTPVCIDRSNYTFYNEKQETYTQFIGSKTSFLNTNNEWSEIPLDEIKPIGFHEITINSLGLTFALDKFFNSYYRTGITTENIKGNNWIKFNSILPLSYELSQQDGNSSLLGTNIVNTPLPTKIGITSNNPLGTTQESTTNIETLQFEAGSNGFACSLSFFENKYIVYFFDKNQKKWIPDSTSKELKQIALKTESEKHTLLAVDLNNKVFIKQNITLQNIQGDTWQEITGKDMQQIYVSPNETIWGLSTEQHHKFKNSFWVYYRKGNVWAPLNTALSKLTDTCPNFLKYGDKISLCTALNRLMQKQKAGLLLDSENYLLFANGATGKNSQTFEIINPTNSTDTSLVKYNDPIMLKTDEGKYLMIVVNKFLYTQATEQKNATTLSFGVISNTTKGNLIEYGTRVKMQVGNQFLVSDPTLLNSNLVLKGDTNNDNGLFIIMKPINNQVPSDQNQIDTIQSPLTLLLQQINQNAENTFKTTAQPDAQATNGFAQLLVALFENKINIPSLTLNSIFQTAISAQKPNLLTQAQRDYVTTNMINKIPDNMTEKFGPLLMTIITKFNENLRTINLPKQAIVVFVNIAYENRALMDPNELNALKSLITNIYDNSLLLTEAEKTNFANLINSLGGTTTTQISTAQQTLPSQLQLSTKTTEPQPQKIAIISKQELQQTRANLQQRRRRIETITP